MFLVGDRVKCLHSMPGVDEGSFYTVSKIATNKRYIQVEGQARMFYAMQFFKLAEAAKAVLTPEQVYSILNVSKVCTCDKYAMMREGCKCGAIKPYNERV